MREGIGRFKYLGKIIARNALFEKQINLILGQRKNWIKVYKTLIESIMTQVAEIWIINNKYKTTINIKAIRHGIRTEAITETMEITNDAIHARKAECCNMVA